MVKENSTIMVTSVQGRYVDKLEINKGGIYTIRWGGYNRLGRVVSTGNYFITLVTGGKPYTAKVVFNGKGSSRLQSEYHGTMSPSTLKQIELLNDYFYNDDGSTYQAGSQDFYVQDSLLNMKSNPEGNYTTTVTATDITDQDLQTEINARVLIQYTLKIPDQLLPEDNLADTLIRDLNDYVNPAYPNPLGLEMIYQGNPALIHIYQQDNALLIDSLQTDSHGESEIGIKITDGNLSDTLYFTINIESRVDIHGQVRDVLDTTILLANARVKIEEADTSQIVYTDSLGRYHYQLIHAVDTIVHYAVKVRMDNYTPYHTWLTVSPDMEKRENNFADNRHYDP